MLSGNIALYSIGYASRYCGNDYERVLMSYQLVARIRELLDFSEQKGMVVLIFLMIIGMIIESAGVGLVAPVILVISDKDILVSNSDLSLIIQRLGVNDHDTLIVAVLLLLVGAYLVKNIFLGFFYWKKISYITNLRMNLSNRLLKKYLYQPYTFHMQHNSGHLIQNVSTEVTIFTGRLLSSLLTLCTEMLVLIGLVILLFMIEPVGAFAVVMMLLGVGGAVLYFTRRHVISWGKMRQLHDGKRIQHLQQGLGGVKDVLFFNKQDYFLGEFCYHNKHSARSDRLLSILQEIPRLFFEQLAVVGVVTIVLIMMYRGQDINGVMVTLSVFVAAAFRLMPSVNRILVAIQAVRYSAPVLDKLSSDFSLKEAAGDEDGSDSKETISFNNYLSLQKVVYSYPGAKEPSLNKVDIKINKGEIVGVIGASGAGKSTLVDAILGLLDADSGKVLVDGKDVSHNLHGWQKLIGYVPQSIFLVDDTLRKNIAFGLDDDEIDDKLVWKAVKDAQLQDYVMSLPDGLDAIVGERGVRLSGGQRQRIGIARALYYDPELLVLDEATSSLDNDTESEIMKTVLSLESMKTIIIVAHRLTTVSECDLIYRLEQGTVIDSGAPETILAES